MKRCRRPLRLLAALSPVLPAMGLIHPAGAGVRTTAFADIDPGPRIMAMGGAGVTAAADPTAAYWNPAGLYFMRGTQATATYDDLYGLGLVQRSYLALAVKTVVEEPRFRDNRMYLTRNLDTGAAYAISLSSLIVDIGEQQYSEFIPAISVAGGFSRDLSLGVTLAYLRASSDLEETSAGGYSAGFGLLWSPPWKGRIGLSVRNLLSRVLWSGEETNRLRVTPGLGVQYPVLERGLLLGDVAWLEGESGPARLSAGAEYWLLAGRLAGRGGLRRMAAGADGRTVPSFGAGLRWTRFDFDYAYTIDEDGPGSTHRFGLNVVLSRPE